MAHQAQKLFFEKVRNKYPEFFESKKVLDLGSLNINGTLRQLFNNCEYVGVDIAPGKDVDVISKAHEAPFEESSFDTVISAEMLEHDEYWELSLAKMYDVLKPGGLLVLSCAGEGRPEHGTRKAGSIWGTSPDYYMNLTPLDMQKIFKKNMFSDYKFEENSETNDTYFYGISAKAYDTIKTTT